eukprot:360443_1
MSTKQKFERRNSRYVNSQAGIFAVQHIKKDEMVCDWSGSTVTPKKTSHTSQIDVNKNVLYNIEDFRYYNHACDPNFYHDFHKMQSFALRDIKIGEELTRFYCCNEWVMVAPFFCSCGAGNCCKYVGGAKYLSVLKLQEYAPYLAPHIKIMLKKDLIDLVSKL